MNSIESIEIRNFKSIRHQKIDGCKRINVFIGYPNVGKSNLLEALSLESVTLFTGLLTHLIRLKEEPTLFFNGFVTNDIELRINDDLIRIVCKYVKSGLTMKKTCLLPPETGSQEKKFESEEFDLEHLQVVGGSSTGEILPYIPVEKYEFRSGMAGKPNPYLPQYSKLAAPFGENIFNIVRTNERLYEEAAALLKEYDLELLYDSGAQTFTILKRAGKGIFTVPYELLADTLQRLIFYKAAVYSNENVCLLFEEPEAHMFPPFIRKFTTDVIFDKTNQFFITTHSPYVLDAFMEDAPNDLAIYLVYYEDGETKVKRMDEKDMDEVREYGVDLFYNLESYLKHGQVNNA